MSFLQTGKALYVLAVICFGGIFVRLAAGSFYKKLIKESANMALTKNRYLRNLKQNAEDTYRINMGMNNAAVYLQRQLGNLKFLGFSLSGLENLAGQLTLLSFLAGGVCAFLSYWNRSDNSYIVLYGAAGIRWNAYRCSRLRRKSGRKEKPAPYQPSGSSGKCNVAKAGTGKRQRAFQRSGRSRGTP